MRILIYLILFFPMFTQAQVCEKVFLRAIKPTKTAPVVVIGIESRARALMIQKRNYAFAGIPENVSDFASIISLARSKGYTIDEVLEHVIDMQPRSDAMFYEQIIPAGTYDAIAKQTKLSLKERLLKAQTLHLRELVRIANYHGEYTHHEIAYMAGMSSSSLTMFLHLANSKPELTFTQALSLADALHIDVRNVFSFLTDFINVD